MHSTRIFYDHFYLKLNLDKLLIYKWNVLHPITNSMFIKKNEEKLNSLFEIAKYLCGYLNNCVLILVKFMKKHFRAPCIIDIIKGILMELNCVIRFIKIFKNDAKSLFFLTLKENCVRKYYFDIKESDKLEMTNELQIKLLAFMNNITKK